jgi:hypothetical protein
MGILSKSIMGRLLAACQRFFVRSQNGDDIAG